MPDANRKPSRYPIIPAFRPAPRRELSGTDGYSPPSAYYLNTVRDRSLKPRRDKPRTVDS